MSVESQDIRQGNLRSIWVNGELISDGGGGGSGGVVSIDQSDDGTSNRVVADIRDGFGNPLTSQTRGLERALSVQIIDASGNQITSFGGSGGGGSGGTVDIDQTTPGTTNNVSVSTATGAGVTIGATSDSIVSAGAAGTISAKLRRLTQGVEDLKTGIVIAAGSNSIGEVVVSNFPAT
jgi:hypothetical protein